jgi:hypothetical protein
MDTSVESDIPYVRAGDMNKANQIADHGSIFITEDFIRHALCPGIFHFATHDCNVVSQQKVYS